MGKKLLVVVVLVAILATLLAPVVYAAPAAQGTTVEELTPVAAYLLLTTFLIPPIIAAFKRVLFKGWDQARKDVAVFVVCLLFGAGEMYINGSMKLTNGDTRQIINMVVINMALTVGAAFVWYKMFWNPSGIDERIAGS